MDSGKRAAAPGDTAGGPHQVYFAHFFNPPIHFNERKV